MDKMYRREPRIYWVKRPRGEKDLLIFDAGYEEGNIYVYEYKESIEVKEIQRQVEELLRSKQPIDDVVWIWVEKKFGYPMTWKLVMG